MRPRHLLTAPDRREKVSSFALTIWTTVSYKRWLRSKICAAPHDPVDKLFVPPSFGDLLNKACFHRNYKDAAEILLGLWTPFQLDRLCESGIPRVIVALARHRNDDDAWAVHRFDVSESSMTTWLFATGEQRLKDERTVAWWHAIRGAWPTAGAKCPSNTSQAIQHIILPAADKHDVSLAAVNWCVALGLLRDRRPADALSTSIPIASATFFSAGAGTARPTRPSCESLSGQRSAVSLRARVRAPLPLSRRSTAGESMTCNSHVPLTPLRLVMHESSLLQENH